jgi:FAD/FMN-containing dehydrogenase
MTWDTRQLAILGRAIDGEVVVPESSDFATHAQAFNAAFDAVAPRGIVRPRSSGDVAETIEFVRRSGLPFAVRSGGHCFAGRSTTTGLLIDISEVGDISVADGLVWIGAGARLGEIYRALLPNGLTIPGGTCPSVGIAGLTLGGGLGMLGRIHGLTADRLVSARIVLADGRVIDCDDDHDPDLFWALRGAGSGRFGVVTELAFRPVPAPSVAVFELTWPFSAAVTAARSWFAWLSEAPPEIVPSLIVAAGGELDTPPRVEVFGAMVGSSADAMELIDELVTRVGLEPSTSTMQGLVYEQALRHWGDRTGLSLDDPRGQPSERAGLTARSEFFAQPPPSAALEALMRGLASDRAAGQSRELDFTPWGGAYNAIPPDATAFVHRTATFLLKHAVTVPAGAGAAEWHAASTWVDASWGAVHRWGTGGVFPNFAEPGLDDLDRAYFGANTERLVEIRSRYDPDALFGTAEVPGLGLPRRNQR